MVSGAWGALRASERALYTAVPPGPLATTTVGSIIQLLPTDGASSPGRFNPFLARVGGGEGILYFLPFPFFCARQSSVPLAIPSSARFSRSVSELPETKATSSLSLSLTHILRPPSIALKIVIEPGVLSEPSEKSVSTRNEESDVYFFMIAHGSVV